MVRLKGLEPARLSTREPKSRMSTNSITGAYEGDYWTAIVKLLKKPIAFAIGFLYGAGNEARTRYLHLGKVALYRMSYARISNVVILPQIADLSSINLWQISIL